MSDFEEHIDKAINEIKQAISSITYPMFPDINKRTIELLNQVVVIIEEFKKAPAH